MTEKIWITNPMVLIKEYNDVAISPDNSFVKNLNNLSKIILYVTVLSFVVSGDTKVIISGIFSLAVFVGVYYLRERQSTDGFEVQGSEIVSTKLTKKQINDYHPINPANPMGNVLPGDYVDNPERKKAPPAYDPLVNKKINDTTQKMIGDKNSGNGNFSKKLFRDLGDNYNFEESMVQFYTTAESQLPNGQNDFAQWCYGNMPSCKEGNEFACAKKDMRYINY